ncbi:aldo/keto reductase [Dactylosporangium sp. AC04546]|uniref:aldo/keto reductase n=1 Tax=Dactylosporangium sp. AC04546 TaxID=2862460 RepID=UPI001EDD90F1|nr:aldo/keto reductase [Dactylosporangium sp. AC04546]WVK82506.1 aldo/keto reductase [Dactylosporangium sp. AC04546]
MKITLNSGAEMPALGYGTYPLKGRAATDAVLRALDLGYRLIDTAASYGNEDAVGAALRESGLPRADIFVTTKLRGSEQGRAATRPGLEASLTRLGLDHVDLYLIHWPMPAVGKYVESYEEMVALQQEGLIRSVGVSNFLPEHLDAVVAATGVQPAVDQLQVSPSFARTEMVEAVQRRGTVVQAWSPLERNTGILDHGVVTEIAARHGVTGAQVVLRWLLERGITAVPHSGNAERQRLNLDVEGFTLSPDEVAAVTALDSGRSPKQDPATWEEF